MTDTFRHKSDCSDADLNRITGRLGDQIDRCRNCGRFRIIRDPSEVTTELSPEPEGVDRMIHYPPAIVGVWVCGIHIDHPVTWRGTGCKACAVEDRNREQARAARRDAER